MDGFRFGVDAVTGKQNRQSGVDHFFTMTLFHLHLF
jgi:hypothetical protein